MNKKVKYLIFVALIEIVIGVVLSNLFPESFKTKITGAFPVVLSFEAAWIIVLAILAFVTVWFVWKIEIFETSSNANQTTVQTTVSQSMQPPTVLPTNPPVVSINTQPISPSNSPIVPPISQSNIMTKDEILNLIAIDLDKAFEELDKVFEAKGVYLDLSKEYFSRPDNFVLDTFRSKLKRFVNINWK